MKYLFLRHATALSTFSVAAASIFMLLSARPTEDIKPVICDYPFATSESETILYRLPDSEVSISNNDSQRQSEIALDDICKSKAKLAYKDYQVTSSFNDPTETTFVTIRRKGKVKARYYGAGFKEEGTRIGLFHLLGHKTKQLIIAQYSGGAHCCYSFRIYKLYPDFHLIFNSENYPIGDYRDECGFLDLNRDGVLEFRGDILTFADDFEGLINIASPRIPMIFKYDKKTRKYNPANQKFLSYALAGTDKEIEEIQILSKSKQTSYDAFLKTLDVVLRYIYAGKEKEAWILYEKDFGGGEKLRSDIKDLLKNDTAYRFIYRH